VNYALIRLIDTVFQIFSFLILVDVIGSWIVSARMQLPNWAYDLLGLVHTITAPVLDPIRRLLPGMGGLDFSPLIALLLLQVLREVVVNALRGSF
jgi:YggT family protein